jgi:transcription factor E
MALRITNSLATEILGESMGKEHIQVIKKLSQPKYDEDIAAELGLKATVVRTLLNDLHAKSLVEYERIKNKSTGWYTYIWKKRDDKLKDYLRGYLEEKLKKLNEELEKETKGVFKCSCSIVSLQQAMENDFLCSECNEQFIKFDNSKNIRELRREIGKTKSLYKQL